MLRRVTKDRVSDKRGCVQLRSPMKGSLIIWKFSRRRDSNPEAGRSGELKACRYYDASEWLSMVRYYIDGSVTTISPAIATSIE